MGYYTAKPNTTTVKYPATFREYKDIQLENYLNKLKETSSTPSTMSTPTTASVPTAEAPEDYYTTAQKKLNSNRATADETTKETYDKTLEMLSKYKDSGLSMNDRNYSAQLDALEKEKRERERAENIEYEKLRKYLPEYMQQQGLGSLGISDTSILKAKADHTNALGDVAADYGENKSKYDLAKSTSDTELLEKYNEAMYNAYIDKQNGLGENENNYNTGLDDLNRYANDKADEEIKYNQEENKKAYDAAYKVLTGQMEIEPEYVQTYIASLYPYLTEEQRQEIAVQMVKLGYADSGNSFADGMI